MTSFNYIDFIGWVATVFTLLSFVFSKMMMLRIINSVGCAFWIAYGLLTHSYPVIVTNIVIASIHVFWFIKWKRQEGNG